MRTMDELLRETADLGASDLHLSAGLPPLMRIHGDLTRTEHPALSAAGVTALVNSIMSEEAATDLPGGARNRLRLRGPR